MLKKTSDALRRADFALAGAFLLTLATAGAAMAISPHTDQLPKLKPSIVQIADIAPAAPAAAPMIALPPPVLVNAPSPRDLALQQVLTEQNCLAEAMYYEARGEGVEGEEAIAEVIFNRMHASGYPRSICGVVYEGAALAHGCQFSFTCDGERDRPKSFGPWLRARVLAARILAGFIQLGNTTGGATSFHASEVQPGWADQMNPTAQIGNHLFYRPLGRTQAS